MRMVRLRPEKRMACQRRQEVKGTQPSREHPVLSLPTLGKAFTLSVSSTNVKWGWQIMLVMYYISILRRTGLTLDSEIAGSKNTWDPKESHLKARYLLNSWLHS